MTTFSYDGNKTLAAVCPGIFETWQSDMADSLTTITGLYNQLAALNPQTLSALTTDVSNALSALKTLATNMATAIGSAQVPAEAAANVSCFQYAGPVDGLGAEVTTALASGDPAGGGPTDACNAFVFLTRTPATWTTMAALFGGG
jgi:hypothetical protein